MGVLGFHFIGMKYIMCTLLLFTFISSTVFAQLKIKGGHSHNDYHQEHPLVEALDNGFVSIEVDVFLRDNELLVGHDTSELELGKTLDALYLSPLWDRYKHNNLDTIILLIDIKEHGEACYPLLKEALEDYKSMLTVYTPDSLIQNNVSVVLSGDRPWSLLNEEYRLAALDGRFDAISFQLGYSYFPLISDNWENFFNAASSSNFTDKNEAELQALVEKCHNQNKLIRFWALPTETNKALPFWQIQYKAKVDLLGSDNPLGFSEFMIGL